MLTFPNHPSFLEQTLKFVDTFIPSLEVHRIHVSERSERALNLQLEMSDGSLLFVHTKYWTDRIQLILEYGWQELELWMFANFPTDLPLTEQALQTHGFHQISMDGVSTEDLDEELFELSRQSSLFDSTFSDLLGDLDLSGMQSQQISLGVRADVGEKGLLVFQRDTGEDVLATGVTEQDLTPVLQSRLQHPILGPSTMNRQFEQSF